MDGTLCEVRMFGGRFAPKNWAFCSGQLLQITEYQALFSLIGTKYGGDGRVNFALPDFNNRVPIGAGQGPGLTGRILGQNIGADFAKLSITEIPEHSHSASITMKLSAEVYLKALNGKGTQNTDPTDAYAADSPANVKIYSTKPSNATMAEIPVTFKKISEGSVFLEHTGGESMHTNIQPSLGIFYIVCINGLFPSRN